MNPKPRKPAVIAVEPLIDARSETNRSWMPWAYVPLFPLGWTHFDRPEATIPDLDTTRYRAEPCDELARSIVTELRREKMVASAGIAGDGARAVTPTHILRGRLRTFYVHESRWTYGPEWYRFSWMWERRLREKLGELAKVLGTTPAPLPPALSEDLRASPPPKMPECLGVDSERPCTAK
jgi:hypothetical protein